MPELPVYHLRGYQRNSTDEQCRHVIEYRGESHTLAEWARIKGIDYGTLYMRLKRAGSTPESILSEKITIIIPKSPMMIEVNGESHTVREWSEINQIPLKCIQSRIRAGWDLRDAVTIPSGGKRT